MLGVVGRQRGVKPPRLASAEDGFEVPFWMEVALYRLLVASSIWAEVDA